jgi:hypothetical protein
VPVPDLDAFTRHLFDRVTRGQSYQAALDLASLFIDDRPSQYRRRDLARHLVALTSNVHGSFNWATDTFDAIEEARAQAGLEPRRVPCEGTVRGHLRAMPPGEVEDLVNGVLRRLFTVNVARGALQGGYDLVVDETAFPYYGQGRMQVSQAPRQGTRKRRVVELRTEASRQAMPMPPDKFHATLKGFPFQVMGVRFTATRKTVPLGYVRRRPFVAENNESVMGILLPMTEGLPPPRWVLMDKGYSSSPTVRLLQEALQRNAWAQTRFLVPVVKSAAAPKKAPPKTQAVPQAGGKERTKARQKWGDPRSMTTVAEREYERAVPVTVGREGERYALVRDWQVSADDARAKCNLFLYYRPYRTGAGEWRMDWEDSYAWIGFFTNAEPTPSTAYAIQRAYSARWGIENMHKRDHGFMGLSKSQKMHPRDICYGLGLMLGALENAHRTQVLAERAMRSRAGQARGRRGRRRVVRTHEILGDFDRQARRLGPV